MQSKYASMITVLLILIASAFTLLYLAEPDLIKRLRNYEFDLLQQLRPRPSQDFGIVIIDVDDESLHKIGQWPWPRNIIADLLKALQAVQPKVIGFDMLFAEADRTAPVEFLKHWQLPDLLRQQIAQMPDPDQELAKIFRQNPVVLGFATDLQQASQALPLSHSHFIRLGVTPDESLPKFTGVVKALPLFEEAAQGNGAILFVPDNDRVIRRVPLLVGIKEQLFPSFDLEIVRVARGLQNYVIQAESANPAYSYGQIVLGDLAIPLDTHDQFLVYYSKPNAYLTIPAWKILSGEWPKALPDHLIVLVGVSARGLNDLHFSASGAIISGIEVHAQVIEQILSQTFMLRPQWIEMVEISYVLVVGSVLGFTAFRRRIGISLVLLIGCQIFALVVSYWLFVLNGWLIDSLTPIVLVLVIYSGGLLIRHLENERQSRWIRSVFSRYVSPNLVNYLIAHPEQVIVNAQRLECSFIMTDLAGSTQFMENADSAKVAQLINDYLDQLIAIAFRYNGTLTRIIGDGVAIMFSAPLMQNDHRQRAIECALEMGKFTKIYATALRLQGTEFCDTRIGVNTGVVLVGNFGGRAIFDYRALGDPINTASRLESVNRYLGTQICISESTLNGCHNVISRPIGQLLLKGKSQAFMTYEPLGINSGTQRVERDHEYEQAYHFLLQNQSSHALAAFQKLLANRPHDTLVAFHIARLQKGEYGNHIVISEK